MDFDVLVIGGGAAGMSCALVLGSGLSKPYAEGKKAGIILHQKSSHLQSASLNNVLGVNPGTTGKEILEAGAEQLAQQYPDFQQILKEKAQEITPSGKGYRIMTNKNNYTASMVVIAVGYNDFFGIRGLQSYVIPHKKAKSSKKRIQLENDDHKIAPGLFVAGTLAGHRSQYAIAIGSGAAVATDILTIWNGGVHTKIHDKIS